jgi:hypothetical protein
MSPARGIGVTRLPESGRGYIGGACCVWYDWKKPRMETDFPRCEQTPPSDSDTRAEYRETRNGWLDDKRRCDGRIEVAPSEPSPAIGLGTAAPRLE